MFGFFYFGIVPELFLIFWGNHISLKIPNEGFLDLSSREFIHWKDIKNIFYRGYVLIDLYPDRKIQLSSNRLFEMIKKIDTKMLLFVIFVLGNTNYCIAQRIDNKVVFNLIPPIFKKKKQTTESIISIKFTPAKIQKGGMAIRTTPYVNINNSNN